MKFRRRGYFRNSFPRKFSVHVDVRLRLLPAIDADRFACPSRGTLCSVMRRGTEPALLGRNCSLCKHENPDLRRAYWGTYPDVIERSWPISAHGITNYPFRASATVRR